MHPAADDARGASLLFLQLQISADALPLLRQGRPLYHKKHFRPVSDAADDPHLFREPTDVQLRGLLTSLSPPKAKLHRLPPFHLHLTTSRGSAGSR